MAPDLLSKPDIHRESVDKPYRGAVLSGKFACLTYHIIGAGSNQYSMPMSQFSAHLELLKRSSYLVGDFEHLELAVHRLTFTPNTCVVLTIDDGHESSMRAADLLQSFGYRATFFVTRDRSLNKANYIREAQIRELRKAGFSVGTHGTTHHKLTRMPVKDYVAELAESKKWLEDVIGESVPYMAAPGGYINRRILRKAYECGYRLVGTCEERMNCVHNMTLPGAVNRVNIRQHFSLDTFRKVIEGSPGFYLGRQIRMAALAVPKYFLR